MTRRLGAFVLLLVVCLLGGAAARALWLAGSGADRNGIASSREELYGDDAQVAGTSGRSGSSERGTERGEGHGVIRGVVNEASDGPPARGLEVALARGDAELRATTGDDGAFAFAHVPAGPGWVLTVGAPAGFADLRIEGLRARSRRVLDLGALTLTLRSGLSGVVVDETGTPAEGAAVAVFPAPEGLARADAMRAFDLLQRPPEPVARTSAGVAGRFRLAGLPAGTWTVVARHPPHGVGRAVSVLLVAGTAPELRIVLPAGHRLLGCVVGPAGLDLAGLTVVAAPKFEIVGCGEAPASQVRAPVAEDGTFVLEGLEARDWTLAVDGGTWIAIRDDDVSVPGHRGVRLALPAGASITGRVLGPDDAPVADAAVCHVDGGWYSLARTASDGTYRLPALKAGHPDFFCIRARGFAPWPGTLDDGLHPGRHGIELDAGENALETHLARSCRVEGVVVEGGTGRPLAGAAVLAVSPLVYFGGVRSTTTDAEGRFALEDLPDERTVFVASCDGWMQPGLERAWPTLESKSVPPGLPPCIATPAPDRTVQVRLELAPATVLRGRVLGPSGDPVARATVRSAPPRGKGELSHLPVLSPAPGVTGADGAFALTLPMRFESLTIEVRAPGLPPMRFEVATPDEAGDVEIHLVAACTIEGTVTGTDGAPIPGVAIRCSPLDTKAPSDLPPTGLRTVTDADGRFGFHELAPTEWELVAAEPRHVTASQHVVAASGQTVPADFRLSPAFVVRGVVLRPDGSAAARASVALRDAEERKHTRTTYAAADGSFAFESVLPGPWVIEASLPGLAPSLPLPVSGESEGLALRLAATRAISGTVRWRDGGPATGLTVTLVRGDGGRVLRRGLVGSDGSFTVPGLAAADWDVSVEDQDGGAWSRRVFDGGGWVAAGTDGISLIVGTGFSIAGRVVSDDGARLPGATVAVARLGDSPRILESERELVAVAGDADAPGGDFRLEAMAPGTYSVTAHAPDGAATTVTAPAGDVQVVLRFCPRIRVRGRVVRANGSGVAGARITACGPDSSRPVGDAVTDATGAFEFGSLVCGRTTFVVEWASGVSGFQPVERALAHGDAPEEVVFSANDGHPVPSSNHEGTQR